MIFRMAMVILALVFSLPSQAGLLHLKAEILEVEFFPFNTPVLFEGNFSVIFSEPNFSDGQLFLFPDKAFARYDNYFFDETNTAIRLDYVTGIITNVIFGAYDDPFTEDQISGVLAGSVDINFNFLEGGENIPVYATPECNCAARESSFTGSWSVTPVSTSSTLSLVCLGLLFVATHRGKKVRKLGMHQALPS